MTKVMKNSLLALLWAIAIVPVYAQKTLPQGLQSYAAGLDQKVIKALQQTGYDLNSKASLEELPGVQQRSGTLQLDSTKTFYAYDFTGSNDSLPLFRTIYEYPQPTLDLQTEYQFENNTWLTVSRSSIFKDDLGRIYEIYSDAFDLEKQDFVPNSRAKVYPHGDSQTLVDSFYVYGWDTLAMDWSLLFFTTYQFDAQDRMIESISSFDYFGQPLLFKDVYSYDANGDNTLVESFALFSGVEIPSGKREMQYQNHLLTQMIAFTDDGAGGLIAQGKTTYTYTSFEKEEQVNTYEWSFEANDWVQTLGILHGYDNAQRENSREIVTYTQEGTEERTLSTYDYVEDDLLATESNYYWSEAYFLSDRKFYYYSDGTLAGFEPTRPARSLSVSPNPSAGEVRLNLEGNALVQIFNTQGALVGSREYEPNNALNLSELPAGLYFLTANAANEYYTGRFVKQ